MVNSPKKVILCILIGTLFSMISKLYFNIIDDFLDFEDSCGFLGCRIFNQHGNKEFIYFFVAIFLNLGAVINLLILNKTKTFYKLSLFIKSTVLLYISIYMFIYLLTYITYYFALLNSIICFTAYAISMKLTYKVKVSDSLIIGSVLLFITAIFTTTSDKFNQFDIIWFLIFTIIFPMFVKIDKPINEIKI